MYAAMPKKLKKPAFTEKTGVFNLSRISKSWVIKDRDVQIINMNSIIAIQKIIQSTTLTRLRNIKNG